METKGAGQLAFMYMMRDQCERWSATVDFFKIFLIWHFVTPQGPHVQFDAQVVEEIYLPISYYFIVGL